MCLKALFCQRRDSAVTWVAPHWLISLLIAWLKPQVWLALSERLSIKNLYRASKDHSSLRPGPLHWVRLNTDLRWLHLFLLLVPVVVDSWTLPIYPLSLFCSIKFIAIIQRMAEIAELTAPVPVNQNTDEREVWRCHQHNKRGFGPQPLLFEKPTAPGQGKG